MLLRYAACGKHDMIVWSVVVLFRGETTWAVSFCWFIEWLGWYASLCPTIRLSSNGLHAITIIIIIQRIHHILCGRQDGGKPQLKQGE